MRQRTQPRWPEPGRRLPAVKHIGPVGACESLPPWGCGSYFRYIRTKPELASPILSLMDLTRFSRELRYFIQENPMNARVVGQLGMKRGGQMPALLDQHRIALIGRQHLRVPPTRRMMGARMKTASRSPVERRRLSGRRDAAVELAAVGVALDADVHQPERCLRRVGDFGGQQDGAGAGSEDGPAAPEFAQRLEQMFLVRAASAWWCSRRRG